MWSDLQVLVRLTANCVLSHCRFFSEITLKESIINYGGDHDAGVCRVADIFAQMNNKMSGDLKKIQVTGKYFVEIWKAIGMESIDDKVCLLCQSPSISIGEGSAGATWL